MVLYFNVQELEHIEYSNLSNFVIVLNYYFAIQNIDSKELVKH